MKFCAQGLSLVAAMFWFSVAQAELRIAVGVVDLQAPSQIQPGGLAAFNEDLGREFCRRLKQTCVVSNVLFADMIPGLENGRFDLGFGNFLRTPEREKRIAFSNSIWRSSSRLVGTAAVASRFESQSGKPVSLDTIKSTRVVAVGESQQHRYLVSIAASRILDVLSVKTMAEAMATLRDGHADFALFPVLSAFALLAQEDATGFRFLGPPVVAQGLGGDVHIGLDKNKPELQKEINAALAEIRNDGTYHRIVRKHFPFNLD